MRPLSRYNEEVKRGAEDERSSLAPPPASIPPTRVSKAPPPLAAPLAAAPGAQPGAGPTRPASRSRSRFTPFLVGLVLACGAVDFVFPLRPTAAISLSAALTLLILPWAVVVMRDSAEARARGAETTLRGMAFHVANITLVLAFVAAKWLTLFEALTGPDRLSYVGSYRNYTAALVVLLVVGAALRGGRVARLVAASADHPARLMAASFGLTSAIGGLLLALPISLYRPAEVSLVDSLFMSVSAVCVTGLATINVADTYTMVGQGILCGLIQVGGLGIMVITAAITMLSGRRLGTRGSAVMAEVVDSESLKDVQRTVAMIVLYTLVLESIGAGLLYLQFKAHPEVAHTAYVEGGMAGAGSFEWAAVFHAVSAFCNDGLSNFRNNFAPFVGSPLLCLTMEVLIVLGGLGFPVIHELMFRWTHRLRGHRAPRLTLNTRVALATTAMLLGGMTLAYLALENGASFEGLGIVERANAALFHSVVARTAGFNVVDVGAMRPATLLLTAFAMFVGGGSGSIAGGIKVTTLAVLFAGFRGELRGQKPRLFDRALPDAVVRRAMGVGFLSIVLVSVMVFLLLLIEKHEPLSLVFEVVSAFSTTGLSTGITPELSVASKLVLIATMLIGRIGPLTAALALAKRTRRENYELPEERVMIG